MPAKPATVEAPQLISRIERADPPLRLSRLNPVDALNARAGNRFDVPGAGVLYGATAAAGAYAETLAGFRAKASMQRALAAGNLDPDRIGPGQVPGAWIATRRLRTFHVAGSLPFVDIEAPTTHTYLTEHAPELLDSRLTSHSGTDNVNSVHNRRDSDDRLRHIRRRHAHRVRPRG